MKILYHHRTLSADGQSVHISEMIKAFENAGHTVIMIGPNHSGKSQRNSNKIINKLRRRLPQALSELLEFFYNFRSFSKLWGAQRKYKPDFIYERANLFNLSGLWLKKITGLPLFLEINAPLAQERLAHSGLSLFKLARYLEELSWRGADLTLPVSNVMADYVRTAGVAEEKIMVCHNGVNLDDYSVDSQSNITLTDLKTDLFSKKMVIGFTGFVRQWHGLDHIIRYLANKKTNLNVILSIAGDGPAVNDLKLLSNKLGVEDRVIFHGLIARSHIPKYLSTIDIAVQPAVTDYASPLKLFEYMAAGRAIVAPDADNIKEILTNDNNGLLYQTEDTTSLYQALDDLVTNPVKRQKLGVSAKSRIENGNFLWNYNASRIIKAAERGL